MDALVAEVETSAVLARHDGYAFRPKEDLVLDKKTPLAGHANGMLFQAFDAGPAAAQGDHYRSAAASS